ncbi:MAG TPA: NHL repeat-containing protein [Rhodocyclaceae bacterium]|nr:NHL repeat-containing protein [Rhodocyclaceae bacterium]
MKPRRLIRFGGGVLIVLAALLVAGWLAFVPSAREPAYVFVGAWGERGRGPGQFDDPTGIAVVGDEVFVADSRNGRIQVFDREGRFRRAFGTPGSAPGELGRPMNLTVHDGRLFVAEYFNDRIQVFGLHGTPLALIGRRGSGPGEFDAPGGVAVAPDGALFVADFYNQRVQQLDADGGFVRQWGATREIGIRAGRFNYPTDVARAADGTLFVADGYNDRIQAFSADGAFSHKWGGPFAMNVFGSFNGWFATVTSVVVDADGNVLAADFYNHRIQKFAADGTFLTRFGTKGSGPGELLYPIAAAAGDDGTVFVVDFGNHRITRWRPARR